jgi:arginase
MTAVSIIVSPFHAGVPEVRVGKGPRCLLEAGLPVILAEARLDPQILEIGSVDSVEGEIGRSFEVMRRISEAVSAALQQGRFPLVLAGNCNASVGVHAGLRGKHDAILWFDAHPDLDTPDECLSGYFDGMGVATMAGTCWRRLAATIPGFSAFDLSNLIYCGIRDFEPGQKEKVERLGIRTIYGSDAMKGRYADALEAELRHLRGEQVHVHLDLDCLDVSVGIANEYAAAGGLTAEDLAACMRRVTEQTRPVAMTIASFNPDFEGSVNIAAAGVAAAATIVSAGAKTD